MKKCKNIYRSIALAVAIAFSAESCLLAAPMQQMDSALRPVREAEQTPYIIDRAGVERLKISPKEVPVKLRGKFRSLGEYIQQLKLVRAVILDYVQTHGELPACEQVSRTTGLGEWQLYMMVKDIPWLAVLTPLQKHAVEQYRKDLKRPDADLPEDCEFAARVGMRQIDHFKRTFNRLNACYERLGLPQKTFYSRQNGHKRLVSAYRRFKSKNPGEPLTYARLYRTHRGTVHADRLKWTKELFMELNTLRQKAGLSPLEEPLDGRKARLIDGSDTRNRLQQRTKRTKDSPTAQDLKDVLEDLNKLDKEARIAERQYCKQQGKEAAKRGDFQQVYEWFYKWWKYSVPTEIPTDEQPAEKDRYIPPIGRLTFSGRKMTHVTKKADARCVAGKANDNERVRFSVVGRFTGRESSGLRLIDRVWFGMRKIGEKTRVFYALAPDGPPVAWKDRNDGDEHFGQEQGFMEEFRNYKNKRLYEWSKLPPGLRQENEEEIVLWSRIDKIGRSTTLFTTQKPNRFYRLKFGFHDVPKDMPVQIRNVMQPRLKRTLEATFSEEGFTARDEVFRFYYNTDIDDYLTAEQETVKRINGWDNVYSPPEAVLVHTNSDGRAVLSGIQLGSKRFNRQKLILGARGNRKNYANKSVLVVFTVVRRDKTSQRGINIYSIDKAGRPFALIYRGYIDVKQAKIVKRPLKAKVRLRPGNKVEVIAERLGAWKTDWPQEDWILENTEKDIRFWLTLLKPHDGFYQRACNVLGRTQKKEVAAANGVSNRKRRRPLQLKDTTSKFSMLEPEENTALLTREEEVCLAMRVEAGDKMAVRRFLEVNKGLVISRVRRAIRKGNAVPEEELLGEAYQGLITAVEKFDYRRGTRFSTCAVEWIDAAIEDAKAKSYTIRMPSSLLDRFRKVRQAQSSLSHRLMRPPTLNEIAQEVGLPEDKLTNALNDMELRDLESLEVPKYPDEDDNEWLGDSISGNDGNPEDLVVGEAGWRQWVREQVDPDNGSGSLDAYILPAEGREREILWQRFGFDDEPQSWTALGNKFGLSKQRVREIGVGALDKLRAHAKKNPDEWGLEPITEMPSPAAASTVTARESAVSKSP